MRRCAPPRSTLLPLSRTLLEEYEEYRQNKAYEGGEVVPLEACPLKTNITMTVKTVSDITSCITLS